MITVVLAMSLFTACATQRPQPGARPSAEPDEDTGTRGIASVYATSLQGQKTANGDLYDPNKLTCAHRSLKFGTRVEVRLVRTGAKAVCVINDRGPFVKDRIIDLSSAMARELGVGEDDIYQVEIRKLD